MSQKLFKLFSNIFSPSSLLLVHFNENCGKPKKFFSLPSIHLVLSTLKFAVKIVANSDCSFFASLQNPKEEGHTCKC